MRDPVTDLDRRGRIIFGGVLLFALAHALLYVVTVPTWDLFDEEQHLSYALYLIDDGEVPEIDDPVQQRILDSAVATDRWSTLRIGRPVAPELNEFGLEGLSYEGYHPPLYYALVSPLTLASGSDAWRELYAARLLGVALLFGFASICWGYARDWLPDADPATWGAIVVAAVSVPAVAAAAGRVNNDLLAGLFLASGTLMAARLLDDRRQDQALFLGLLTAAAVLTKGQGIVLLLVAATACGLLLARRQLSLSLLLMALAPGVLALAGWTAWTWARYETLNGADAYLDTVGVAETLGIGGFIEELWLNGWSSYWGAYDGGLLRWATGTILLVVLVVGFVGLLRGAGSWWQRPEYRERLLLCGVLCVGLLGTVWFANDSGLAHPHGRMLIGAVPALTTLTVAGMRRLGGEVLAVQVGLLAVALSGVYFLFWYLPFFY